MTPKTGKYITELVKFLEANGKVMSYQQLITHLKFNDINEYSHPRGIGQGIEKLHRQLKQEGKDAEAGCLACRIVKSNKKFGWDKSNIKSTLYLKQKGICTGCKDFFVEGNLSKDHIIPSAKGGTDEENNLQLLCRSCNSIKGKRDMDYLLNKLQGI